MYFYTDNIQESILIFQKGRFDYTYLKTIDTKIKESSKIDIPKYQTEKWYLTVWDITNLLPLRGRIEHGVAAFPEEIPKRLIKLFTFVGETVLDPFLGSGTTTKVSRELGRNSFGYELDRELKEIIMSKIGYGQVAHSADILKIVEREDAKNLRTSLNDRVKKSTV